MATVAQWIEGARPRTLPNAVAPVIAGTGAAAWLGSAVWWKALLALTVALALIVGVNYANDYSDGVRGTDDDRVGPLRLVGSRVAAPRAVLTAAVTALLVAAVAGVALAWVTNPWLIAVGAACIAGAWLYTGGSKPYGYSGFGEIAVFVFFGLVAVLGTQYTQALRVDRVGLACAVAMGCLSSAVLVAIGSNGAVCVRIGGSATHLVIDVAGWFQPGTDGLSFNATPAQRLYDSRPGTPPAANTLHQVTTGGVAVLSQVDGARWLSLEGRAGVSTDPESIRDAELRYAQRYRTPRPNPRRVVIEVHIERVLGSSELLDRGATED